MAKKQTTPGYSVRVRRNGTITFKSHGDFDLRNVPALQAMGLPPPEPKESAPADAAHAKVPALDEG